MNDESLRAALALWRVPGIGPERWRRLIEQCGDPQTALRACDAELQRCQLTSPRIKALRIPDWRGADSDLDWSRGAGCAIIDNAHPAYPDTLRTLPGAPPLLFVRGDLDLLRFPALAVVGSRNPTDGGLRNAKAFAATLAARGLAVISGLALGIDAAAHHGALHARGATIAVMATGPDRIYPQANRPLAKQIAQSGLLVTEFPTGVMPHRAFFPRRNRLICGLALGTLVVEAALRSGSLITARQARDQGREVFAIPGSIHNPLSRGCHQLIRQGAKLVESADDIYEEIGPQLDTCQPHPAPPPDAPAEAGRPAAAPTAEHRQLLSAMGYDPIGIDTLVERLELTPEAISSMLLILELEGHVVISPGGTYTRVSGETT